MIVYVILGLVGIVLLWGVLTYNKLIMLHNRVRNSWSQVDVVIKNRFDLIPNLVDVVKGYTAHEKETLYQLTQLRTKYVTAGSVQEKVAMSGQMSDLLSRLMVNVENYPDLKASENFLYLKEQLSEIEDKIRYARQFYNDAVEIYNTAVMSFPANIIASRFRFKEESFFKIDDAEKAIPDINL